MEQSNLWVEDSLHDILGLSDDKTVQYLTSMASQASSTDKLKQELLGSEFLPNSEASVKFIEKLHSQFSKAVPQQKPMSRMQREEQQKVKEMQTLNKYSMLRDNDSDEDEGSQSDSEGEATQKMTQFGKDLQTIKDRTKQSKDELAKLQRESQTKLSKREEKQMKKILKEQDKLERQALVERMQMKD